MNLVKEVEAPSAIPAFSFEFASSSDQYHQYQQQQQHLKNKPSVHDLMDDVQLHILSFLNASDARSVSATCHQLRRLVLSEDALHLWKEWCCRRWPMLSKSIQNNALLKDDIDLPTAVGSLQQQANVSILLGMAAQTQPYEIDQTKFSSPETRIRMARWNRRVPPNWHGLPNQKPVFFRTFEYEGMPVVQFTGMVGSGDRCIRSDQPLPRPKIRTSQGTNGTSSLLHSFFHWNETKNVTPLWRPFVAPYVTNGINNTGPQQVHLTPRLVSYYEITILERKESQEPPTLLVSHQQHGDASDCVAIGVSSGVFPMHSKMPGWDDFSYGYHGDDGGIFHASGDMLEIFGSSFGVGDTVGCGVDYVARGIFFTLNGKNLGYAWKGIPREFLERDLYPTVGVDSNNPIACNFGERPFLFDLTQTFVKQYEQIVESFMSPLKAEGHDAKHDDMVAQTERVTAKSTEIHPLLARRDRLHAVS